MSHQSLHEALKVDVVDRHSTHGLEYAVIKLQRSKTDVQHTLHARSALRTFSDNVTQADLLRRIGFSVGPCTFVSGGQCVAKEIPVAFDVRQFAGIIDKAFSDLQAGIQLLFECGFYLENRLFGRKLPSLVSDMQLA